MIKIIGTIAIEIENRCIKLVAIENCFGTKKIKLLKEIQCNCISDENIITNIDNVSCLIKNEISSMKLPFKQISYTIQNKNIINRNVNIINTNHKEDIYGLIKYELNQYMPIDLEKYVLKYRLLEENIKSLDVQAILMPKLIVQNYKKLSKNLKIIPKILDVNFNALQNLIKKDIVLIDNKENIILDIKKDITNVNKINGKNIISSHTVENNNLANFINNNMGDINNIYYYGIEEKNLDNEIKQKLNLSEIEINKELLDIKNLNKFINNIGLAY